MNPLPTAVIDPSTPDWARMVITNSLQPREDARYKTAVAAYQDYSQNWVNSNVLTRSLNPASFVPSPFTMATPRYTMYTGWDPTTTSTDAQGNQTAYTVQIYTDIGLIPPTLPPFVTPAGASTGQIKEVGAAVPADPTQSGISQIITNQHKIMDFFGIKY